MRILKASAQIVMKIDQYYQRRKCRPMTLVYGNTRCTQIFAGVPMGGGIKWRRQILAI